MLLQSSFLRYSRFLPKLRHYSSGTPYDLIVIGAGPGGYVAAIRAAQLGLKTACVEKRGSLGGTCLNVGCIPSKALLNNSHLFHMAKHDFAKRGINVSDVSLNLPTFLSFKEKTVSQLTKGIEFLFKKNKVDYLNGHGKIVGADSVQVTDAKGTATTYSTKNILIATGSESVPLPGLTIDEKSIVTSTGALSFTSVPKKFVVIGGGIVGLELGSVWSRLGSEVTVVEFLDSIGAGMDSAVATHFMKILQKQGIKFRMGTKVNTGKAAAQGGYTLEVEPAKGGAKESIVADAILVSVGRRPYTDNLGLESVGVQKDNKGRIKTDQHFKTNIPSIRAIGDVITGPMLAHKAEDEGIAVVNMIANGHGHVNYDVIPSVIYTHPEVAWVGQSEEQLKANQTPYEIGNFPFMANSRAKTNDDMEGFVKVISHKESGKLLGCHVIGPNAGEMIAEAALAMQLNATAEQVADTCHAHPTLSEALKEACMAASTLKKPIHF